MLFDIEVTGTFGGEANYSWVLRYSGDSNVCGCCARPVILEMEKRATFWW